MFSILIIENDLKVRELLRLFLQHEGFSVLCASNCYDATKFLKSIRNFKYSSYCSTIRTGFFHANKL